MRFPVLLVAAVLTFVSIAHAQSTAFTYQGQLKNGLDLAEGAHDFRLKLFSAASGGSQLGSTQCADNVTVKNGVFTALIDFGPQFLAASDRWLEIEVRQDTGLSCGNTTGYTVLSPRQAITPTPRAQAATTANSLSLPNGSSVLVNLTNSGLVGIGTNAPTSQLHLNGVQDAFKITGNQPFMTLTDTNFAGNPRVELQNSQGNYYVVSESFLNGTNSGGFTVVDQQGRLGLGVFDPALALDVGGRMQLRGASGASSGSAGIYLTSPVFAPTVRAFVGLLDDTHVGLFGSVAGWSFTMDTLSGNVGIGTTTPTAKLDVRGSVRFGASSELLAAGSSEENLRIVRGTVNDSAQILRGSGFSVLIGPAGTFTITLARPFGGVPSAVASTVGPAGRTAQVTELSESKIQIDTQLSGTPHNVGFSFIAVGPR